MFGPFLDIYKISKIFIKSKYFNDYFVVNQRFYVEVDFPVVRCGC